MNKSFTIKGLFLLAAFVFAGFGANAQLKHLEQSFYFNGNLPMLDFNDAVSSATVPMTPDSMGMDATIGMGIGYRVGYRFNIGFGDLTPYIGADLQWNAIRGDHRDAYELKDCSKPNYMNLAAYAGINYRYSINDIVTPFVEFGLGSDFLFITKEEGVVTKLSTAATETVKFRYVPTSSFAWQIGAGTFLGNHVSMGIYYSGYGKHTIKYTDKTFGNVEGTDYARTTTIQPSQLRKIGLLSFRFGFHF